MDKILDIYLNAGYSLEEIKNLLEETKNYYSLEISALEARISRSEAEEQKLKELKEKNANNNEVLNFVNEKINLQREEQNKRQKAAEETKKKEEQDKKDKLIQDLQKKNFELAAYSKTRKEIIQGIISKVLSISTTQYDETIQYLKEKNEQYQEAINKEKTEVLTEISRIYYDLQTIPNINLNEIRETTKVEIEEISIEDVKKQYTIIAQKIKDLEIEKENNLAEKDKIELLIQTLKNNIENNLKYSLKDIQEFENIRNIVDEELKTYPDNSKSNAQPETPKPEQKNPIEEQFKKDIKDILEAWYKLIIETTELDAELINEEQIIATKTENNNKIQELNNSLKLAMCNELQYPGIDREKIADEVREELSSYIKENKDLLASIEDRKQFRIAYLELKELSESKIKTSELGTETEEYKTISQQLENKILEWQQKLNGKATIIVQEPTQDILMSIDYKKGEETIHNEAPAIQTLPENLRNKQEEPNISNDKKSIKILGENLNFGKKKQKANKIINLITTLDGIKIIELKDRLKIEYKKSLVEQLEDLKAKINIVAKSVDGTEVDIETKEQKNGRVAQYINNPSNVNDIELQIINHKNKELASINIQPNNLEKALEDNSPSLGK